MGLERREEQEDFGHQAQNSSAPTAALAAVFTTICTKSILHPLDTIKCRLQSSGHYNLLYVWRYHSGKWGLKYLYSGLPVKLAFYMPYQAIYIGTYDTMKTMLQLADTTTERSFAFLARTIFSAAVAELMGCVVRVPMETMKIRLQAAVVGSTHAAVLQLWHGGFFACARLVKAQTLLNDIPFSSIQWCLYETFRRWAVRLQSKEGIESESSFYSTFNEHAKRFLFAFLTGGFSGLVASAVTVPLDTIRTRVVVASATNTSITIRSVVQSCYRVGGVRFFFAGGFTRILWVSSNAALYFPLFELFKVLLLPWQEMILHHSCITNASSGMGKKDR